MKNSDLFRIFATGPEVFSHAKFHFSETIWSFLDNPIKDTHLS